MIPDRLVPSLVEKFDGRKAIVPTYDGERREKEKFVGKTAIVSAYDGQQSEIAASAQRIFGGMPTQSNGMCTSSGEHPEEFHEDDDGHSVTNDDTDQYILDHWFDDEGMQIESSGMQIKSSGMQIESSGMQIESNGMQIETCGMQIESNGMQIKSDGLQHESSGVQSESSGMQVMSSGSTGSTEAETEAVRRDRYMQSMREQVAHALTVIETDTKGTQFDQSAAQLRAIFASYGMAQRIPVP